MAETKLELAKNCANLELCRKILNECCQVGFFSILILSILCAELLFSIDYVVYIYFYHVHSIISLIFILCRLFQVSKTYRQIEDGSVFSSLTIEQLFILNRIICNKNDNHRPFQSNRFTKNVYLSRALLTCCGKRNQDEKQIQVFRIKFRSLLQNPVLPYI